MNLFDMEATALENLEHHLYMNDLVDSSWKLVFSLDF